MTAGTLAGLGDATVGGCSLPRMPTTGNLERGGEGRKDRLQWDGWFRSRGHGGSPPVRYIPDTERERDGRGEGGVSDGGEYCRLMCACAAPHFNNASINRRFPNGNGCFWVSEHPRGPGGASTINADDKRRLAEADEGKSATSLTPGGKISWKGVVRDPVDSKPEGSQWNRSLSIF